MLTRRRLACAGIVLILVCIGVTLGFRAALWNRLPPGARHFDLYVNEGANLEVRDSHAGGIDHQQHGIHDPRPILTIVDAWPQYLAIIGLAVVGLTACGAILLQPRSKVESPA